MDKSIASEEFDCRHRQWMPANIQTEVGHFNVFRIEDFNGKCPKPSLCNRKDFYKIKLIHGRNKIHYADTSFEIEKNALLFSNPLTPYSFEKIDELQSGFFCIFTEAFLSEFPHFREYAIFKPSSQPILILSDEQVKAVSAIYLKMFDEINSEYDYKYELLRNYVFELVHFAMKLQPIRTVNAYSNASTRISALFVELLERQFPIESPFQQIRFRSPIEYSKQLGVHVNHLNRALKTTTGKTTTELIAERLIQEAVALLKHTNWNIAEIAYTLGFEEPTHFNNFFKKRTSRSPAKLRIV